MDSGRLVMQNRAMTEITSPPSPRFSLTVRDAAQALGLSERCVWRLIKMGRLRSVAVNSYKGRDGRMYAGRRLVAVSEIERFLTENAEPGMQALNSGKVSENEQYRTSIRPEDGGDDSGADLEHSVAERKKLPHGF